MRVLVCGGRHYHNQKYLFHVLDSFHRKNAITGIVHGGASGADTLAGDWAKQNGVFEEVFPAKWEQHGKSAGPIRNRAMADTMPDLVCVFPGGRGTDHMLKTALDKGLDVWKWSETI